ncbi:MAG: hypothetical protein OXG49_10060 [Chloroflexi bacterium]|nr:hypothetical protein [Chloroflexota bacterium]
MQSGDLVSVVQFNGYRFEDVFLSQALRIQNFIELGAWFARYFGVPVSRQAIHYHAVSYGIQEVYVDYKEYARLAEKYGFLPKLRERRHEMTWNSLVHGDLDWRVEADDRAELRRCVFGALLQHQSVDRALERLRRVDHLPVIKRKRLTYLKARMTIARVQVDRGEYVYLADKFGFEPAPHTDAFRPLVWDGARHNPGMWKQRLGI